MSFKEDDEEIEIVSEAIETLGQELLREVAQKALAVGLKPEVGGKVSDLPPPWQSGSSSPGKGGRRRAQGRSRDGAAAPLPCVPAHPLRRLHRLFRGTLLACCLVARGAGRLAGTALVRATASSAGVRNASGTNCSATLPARTAARHSSGVRSDSGTAASARPFRHTASRQISGARSGFSTSQISAPYRRTVSRQWQAYAGAPARSALPDSCTAPHRRRAPANSGLPAGTSAPRRTAGQSRNTRVEALNGSGQRHRQGRRASVATAGLRNVLQIAKDPCELATRKGPDVT